MSAKKVPKKEVLQKLESMLRRVGLQNINFSKVADEMGWERRTIKKWCMIILDNIDPEDIAREAAKSYLNFQGMEQSLGILTEKTRGNTELHLKVIEGKRKFEESKIKILEGYGYKDKVGEKLELSGGLSLEGFVDAFRRYKEGTK